MFHASLYAQQLLLPNGTDYASKLLYFAPGTAIVLKAHVLTTNDFTELENETSTQN